MELQQKLDLIFDVDAVLRGQGADAAILRARRPKLVEVAEKAMQESYSLLNPKVVYKEFMVEGVQHERLLLQGGRKIDSKLLALQLAAAERVIVILTTIGMELEERVSAIWDSDMVYALALDGSWIGIGRGAGQCSLPVFRTESCRRRNAGFHAIQSRDGGLVGRRWANPNLPAAW